MGIARDDASYIEMTKHICAITECFQLIQSPRDWGWYLLVSIFKVFMSSERAVLALSGFGLAAQLLIINQLCREKLLALTLFLPLVYLYYDFTFLRASLALTAFFVGLYFLTYSHKILGSTILLGNYFFHSQGIFSIGIIPLHQITKHKYFVITLILALVICIYLQFTPSFEQLSFLSKNESATYWDQYQSGLFNKERAFPAAHLLIIGYITIILLINKSYFLDSPVNQYALSSLCLAVALAWFFAPIHAIQTRLFDFYLAPLVFLAGNLRPTRINLVLTLALATLLYIRMELLHNWVIG